MFKKALFYGGITVMTVLTLAGCGSGDTLPAATRPAPPTLDAALTVANTLAPQATTSSPTVAPASNSQNAPTDAPPDVIRRAMLAQLQASRERVTNKLTSADGTVNAFVMEFIAPANFHIRSDTMELIAVEGKGAWMKEGDAWQAADPALAQAFTSARDPENIQELLDMIVWGDAKFLGAELLNGKPMWLYTYPTVVKGLRSDGSDIHGTNQLWIGALDGLPYKLVSESDSLFTNGGKDRVEQLHEYDAAFTIEPPL
ncbi:MAG: hypothetical protein BroJett039_11080 [Chloroflexota bacterium]|nr:MAG: hypothetical protein BroJett039_11080 [Chloroflexota bacterium]